MSYKKFVYFINLFFLLGATLLTFFLILAGGRTTGVLKNFYWFQASTSGFNSAPSVTRWYNYNWCGWESRGIAVNCSSKMAAQPFSPRDNFGSSPPHALNFFKQQKCLLLSFKSGLGNASNRAFLFVNHVSFGYCQFNQVQ